MRLSLVTCTGGRPEAFALCERWMGRQTEQWHEWIVVDDCEPETAASMGQVVVRPMPRWDGKPTLGRNMLAGLERVTGDAVLFIEDDDWYAPDYLENIQRMLKLAPMVGEGWARYYNVRTRKWANRCNAAHATTASTACRVECIPAVVDVINSLKTFCYDLGMWRAVPETALVLNVNKYVGIKGMPGRPGLALGHRDTSVGNPDPDMVKLREWIGDDSDVYRHFAA
jgi:glycosyltransferase involved in cell wall biosynthesis